MTALIVVIVVLLVGSLAVSGFLYSRQQLLAHRQSQLRMQKQKYEELEVLFQVFIRIEETPEITLTLNKELLKIARSMLALDKHSEPIIELVAQATNRGESLVGGALKPKGEKLVQSDDELKKLKSFMNDTSKRLQRFHIRGLISKNQFDHHVEKIKSLALEIEVTSHLAFAEKLIGDENSINAINHLKHAREALKRSAPDIPNRNERIREISEQITELSREGTNKKDKNTPSGADQAQSSKQKGRSE